MRSTAALAFVLAACATGAPPTGDDDDGIDARPRPDAPDGVAIDAAEPDAMTGDEMTAQEFLCNDSFDNDNDGQTDCVDTNCAWACTVLGAACTSPNKLRAYSLAPMPQTISDLSTVNATAAVTQTGTIVVAAVRVNLSHTYDSDVAISARSPGNVTLDLSSNNGGSADNYINTVFLDAAGTAIISGSSPFTGSFRPEAALSGWNGQSIAGTWTGTVQDQVASDSGNWTEMSLGLCVAP